MRIVGVSLLAAIEIGANCGAARYEIANHDQSAIVGVWGIMNGL